MALQKDSPDSIPMKLCGRTQRLNNEQTVLAALEVQEEVAEVLKQMGLCVCMWMLKLQETQRANKAAIFSVNLLLYSAQSIQTRTTHSFYPKDSQAILHRSSVRLDLPLLTKACVAQVTSWQPASWCTHRICP